MTKDSILHPSRPSSKADFTKPNLKSFLSWYHHGSPRPEPRL